MASAELHIKDSYYFEVPKALWKSNRLQREDFPSWWVRLDSDYQLSEASHIYQALEEVFDEAALPEWGELKQEYIHWKHQSHANASKPFDRFLLESQPWFREKLQISKSGAAGDKELWNQWQQAKENARQVSMESYHEEWDVEKVEGYNRALDGKVLVPQPFGELTNLHEPASGFCISKFMIIELVVACIIVLVFTWLARRVRSGEPARGPLSNLLEAILVFLRDEVARPTIGKKDADRFVPLLWTIFLFILGCNLMGMVPWVGAPTGAFGATFGMACVTFGAVLLFGTKKFGFVGFWLNQIPSMDLPWYLAIPIKPMIFAIEILGLFIKHGVLAVRLLANMVAGHLVLLGIMGLAFSVEGAMNPNWGITAVIAVVASTLFSLLELFVAFLQAYIFTFLSSLFIGAAIHHH